MAAKALEHFTLVETKAKHETQIGEVLSRREQEVLGLVAQGLSNKRIVAKLFIAENTVKVHLSHILEKLHVHGRREAAVLAAEEGLPE